VRYTVRKYLSLWYTYNIYIYIYITCGCGINVCVCVCVDPVRTCPVNCAKVLVVMVYVFRRVQKVTGSWVGVRGPARTRDWRYAHLAKDLYVCIYVCILYIYIYMYIHTYIRMYICIHTYGAGPICMYIRIYTCMYVYMYVCMYVCMYMLRPN
jgi:hypothetical protein